jgi:hypothetical protein
MQFKPHNKNFALGRLKAGQMNQLEALYSAHLNAQQIAGDLVWFKFEGLKFRLADNTFYTPDFAVMASNGQMQMHEVKGYWEDDARVKIKVAASLFPFAFIGVTALAKKAGGGWAFELF